MERFLALAVVAFILVSCGSTSAIRSPRYRTESPKSELVADARMVIYNANAQLVVTNVDTLNNRLMGVAKKYDGYVVVLGNRVSTIRVKSHFLEKALADVSLFGKIKRKVVSGEDVTEQYNDLNIRLDNANKARMRYLDLLAKAENVEAALKVEKELERLNGEIDLLTGKITRLKHLADFSTIQIEIIQKEKLGLFGYIGVGLFKGVKWLFVRN